MPHLHAVEELGTSKQVDPCSLSRRNQRSDPLPLQSSRFRSRSHLENTGESVVTSALWWENVGHFQISYWFNIAITTALGGPLDGISRIYRIEHCELGLAGMKEMMWAWLGTH